jgi:hypothetical protein
VPRAILGLGGIFKEVVDKLYMKIGVYGGSFDPVTWGAFVGGSNGRSLIYAFLSEFTQSFE